MLRENSQTLPELRNSEETIILLEAGGLTPKPILTFLEEKECIVDIAFRCFSAGVINP